RLLEVEVDAGVVVGQVTDGQVLPEVQFVVATAGRQQERALKGRRPDDGAVQHPVHVVVDRVAVVGGLAHGGVGVRAQEQCVGPAHPCQPEGGQRATDHGGEVAGLRGQL